MQYLLFYCFTRVLLYVLFFTVYIRTVIYEYSLFVLYRTVRMYVDLKCKLGRYPPRDMLTPAPDATPGLGSGQGMYRRDRTFQITYSLIHHNICAVFPCPMSKPHAAAAVARYCSEIIRVYDC